MADKAHKQTDKEIEKMEKELKKIYSTNKKEVFEKWNAYMDRQQPKLDEKYSLYQAAIKSGTGVDEAKKVYEDALKNVTIRSDEYKAMVKQTTENLANVNQTAIEYVNGKMPKVYALNNNFANGQIKEAISGYKFDMVNDVVVENLVKNKELLLPAKKVSVPKDMKWNTKQINSQVLQGILQGESIKDISKRLLPIMDNNKNASVRNARTMCTSAENKGRIDSYHHAEEMGIKVKKQWVATEDDRTREWHSDLDGVSVEVDEPFENEYGEIMYPGDPDADPANVYNCRCTLIADVRYDVRK